MNCEHAIEGLCASCEDERHRTEHPVPVDGCFACKLDRVQWGASVAPKHASKPVRPTVQEAPSWERGIAGEHRPGGTFMPYIDGSLRKIHVKEAAQRRHEFADAKKRLAHNPAPVA